MITNGILNINKSQNMTSHDVVAIVRRKLGIKRVGHTGTLDPMATGVLPVCVGKATRVMEYLDLDFKTYRAKVLFGIETDTQDIWGTELKKSDTDMLTKENILRAFEQFQGIVDQVPPMYSALKVNGKKLYEYARNGENIQIKSRKIFINKLQVEEISIDGDEKTATFVIECSKGTYIRTICKDVGDFLGCGSTLCQLERVRSGIFSIENTINVEDFKNMDVNEIDKEFLECSYPLTHFGKAICNNEETAMMFVNGWHLPMEKCNILKTPEFEKKDFVLPIRKEYKQAYNVYGFIGTTEKFLGVAFYNESFKKLVADKIFYVKDCDI